MTLLTECFLNGLHRYHLREVVLPFSPTTSVWLHDSGLANRCRPMQRGILVAVVKLSLLPCCCCCYAGCKPRDT